nr:threo-3-hydroxy-L-aspartate ammonia-lyase [Kineosporia sp. A_224]
MSETVGDGAVVGFGWADTPPPRVTRSGPVLGSAAAGGAGSPAGGSGPWREPVPGEVVGQDVVAASAGEVAHALPLGSPTYSDVVAAAGRLDGVAHRTPVLSSRLLDSMVGAQVRLKCESLQRMGAFKFRGAYNALARLDPAHRAAGVVSYSSGNHAQAVALAASLLGMPATIVMPHDAPQAKLDATLGYGGRVVQYDRYDGDPAVIAGGIAAERGSVFVPPFDHPDVIAGQGTATRELLAEVSALDALYVPLGGGGLLSGACVVAAAIAPGCRVYGVEPEAGDDGRQSLAAGTIVTIPTPRTIADGAQTTRLGDFTFPIIRAGVDGILTATDDELVDTMKLLYTYLKIVVEPTGCLALAAVRRLAREEPEKVYGRRIGVVLSGGNIDLGRFVDLVSA